MFKTNQKSQQLLRFLSLSIARAQLSLVDRAVQHVLSRIAPGRFRRRIGQLHLSDLYEIEPPAGAAHLFKVAMYSPRQSSSDCVMITNVADGWNSLCHLIAREHLEFQIQVISTRPGVEYPQNFLEVWRAGESVRKIMAMRDSDKWLFFQEGTPEGFEETERYNLKTKRDRLNRDSVIRSLRKIGWNIEQSSFWTATGDAIYFDETRKG